MSNLNFIPDNVSRRNVSYRVIEKEYVPSDELSEVDFIKLNRRLRYGRQPIPGNTSVRYRKFTYKY